MTLQTLNHSMLWPGTLEYLTGTPSIATQQTLDAAGEYQALIFCARQAMTISHVGWRCGAATDSPTADTRVETVDTDGNPSGTLWATDTNLVSGALTANTFALHALTASASITAGQMVCIKIGYNSGTSFVVQRVNNMHVSVGSVPYTITNTSGSVVKSLPPGALIIALGSSTTAFYDVTSLFPADSFTASAFNNTNSAARGLRFQVPFKCRCVGLRAWLSNSSGDFNIFLADDAGSELSSSSTAFDGNHNVASANGTQNIYFDSPVTLSPSTWYRAAVEPSSATNTTVGFLTLPSADYRSGMPGGTNHHYTTLASGSWTDSATSSVPLLDILLDQLDDGVATVAPQHGNMTGGMQ